ncbi:MAG TPA: trehalose-phosphatase [Thermoanaerobaculia bacterium]|nr:trehalose-phosphatase [Thermoanaerobaculia bacterium]
MTRTLLLATDFDGTVAPIVDTPEQAVIHSEMAALLTRASERPGITVAFLTGRDAGDVRGRTAGVRAYIAGSHGLECESPEGRTVWTPSSELAALDGDLLEELEQSGVRVERKRHGVSLHFRGTTITDGRRAVDRFEKWAKSNALELVAGRCVIEARMRGGDKRLALVKLASITRAARVVFAGDDLTDFAAIRWASQRGRGLFVMSGERKPPHAGRVECVASIDSLCQIFGREIDAWNGTNRRLGFSSPVPAI